MFVVPPSISEGTVTNDAVQQNQVFLDSMSVMTSGEEQVPNPFVLSNEEFNKRTAAASALEATQLQTAVARYPLLRRNQDGSAVSSNVSVQSSVQDWREAYNAYYHPPVGSVEESWPTIDVDNPVENSQYLALAVRQTLTHMTTLPVAYLTGEDVTSIEKVSEFITICTRHNLHPFIRWSMISETARRSITLCCHMKVGDARRDWPNWSNTAFLGLYKIFCGDIILKIGGGNATAASIPQLQAKLETTLFEFARNLSKVDLSPEGPAGSTARMKVFKFLLSTRTIEDETQYFELLQQGSVQMEIAKRLVARCRERKSLLAANPRVVELRAFLDAYDAEGKEILTLNDFYQVVTEFLVMVAQQLDKLTIWSQPSTWNPPKPPVPPNNGPSTGGPSNRGGLGRDGGRGRGGGKPAPVKLYAVKSGVTKPVGGKAKPAPAGTNDKWICRTCGRKHQSPAGGGKGNCPFNLHKHPDRNQTSQLWEMSPKGREWKAKDHDVMPLENQMSQTLDGAEFDMNRKNLPKAASGEIIYTQVHSISANNYARLPCQLHLNRRLGTECLLPVPRALADTGSSEYSFICPRFVQAISKEAQVAIEVSNVHVSGALRGQPSVPCSGKIPLPVRIFNELNKKYETITIDFHILDIEDYDIIIGRIDIRTHDILKKCHDQIMWDTRSSLIEDDTVAVTTLAAHYSWLGEYLLSDSDHETDNEIDDPTKLSALKPTRYSTVEGSTLGHIYDYYKQQSRKKRIRSTTNNRGRLRRRLCNLDRNKFVQREYDHRVARAILLGINSQRCVTCANQLTDVDIPPPMPTGTVTTSDTTSGTPTPTVDRHHKVTTPNSTPSGMSKDTTGITQCANCSGVHKATTALMGLRQRDTSVCTVHEYRAAQAILNRLNDPLVDTSQETDAHAQYHTRLSAISDPDKERPSDHLKQWNIVPGTITSSQELLPSDDTDDTPEDTALTEPEIESGPVTDDLDYLNVTIKGNDKFKELLTTLVHKYKDVFASKLPAEPARVTPMTFKVEQDQWIKPATRQSYRRQTVLKDAEVVLKISTLLKCGAIRRSSARAWSQVLLTPKPNNKWRFCIDFRLLNDATSPKGWPLPRIKELVHRIGHHKPQWFGKMDLTDGYFQMPLAVNSRENTAFITSHGLYEWTRVPIGLKNAAAYFQEVITQEVLAGLVMHTCEVYIDDVAIHATSEEQFLQRLEEILLRFRKHNVKLQGKKCEFGLTEIEILGHVIDSTGVTFSYEKLRGVDDTLLPTTGTKLLSFLGLANYFRDNVRNIHEHEGPLRQLASAHPKSSVIQWTPALEDHFYKLKTAVWSCTKVHFVDDRWPIFLHTDACDHGIGAYLFQVDNDGKEIPIGFLSRSLRGAECRWSTFEQEGFAIFKALEKFEYLIRDAQFTIRTDHRNLLFMNEKASNKVQRWKNAIQQYNFVCEHIPGADNIVADHYSRLNSLNTSNSADRYSEESIEPKTSISATLASMTSDIPYVTELHAYKSVLAAKRTRLNPSASVIPTSVTLEHQDILKTVHNFTSGHSGTERTLDRLHAKGYKWPGMRQDVMTFVKQCPACQMMRESRIPILVKPFHLSVFNPMERLNIDTIGPLPPDEEGNEHILVIIDVFSRFVELVPCKDVTAASATKALLAHIGRYGSPAEVLTDNGSQFIADVTQQLLKVLDILPLTILPYSHEENGIVERVNKEVVRHLRAILFDRQIKNQWALVLPLVQRIHNATPHSSTNVAPAQLIFGHTLDLDRGILHERKSDSSTTWHEYIHTLLNAQARIIAVAQQTQRILNDDNIVKRNNITPTEFESGSYVLMTHYQYKDGVGSKRPSKLDQNYRGPFLVVSNDATRYSLQNLVTGDTFDTHVTTLQPFHFDPKVVDPKVVARQAAGEFFVEHVLEIRGNKNPKNRRFYRTDLELLIKWTGYDESYNTWEPYKELRFNAQFHEFCRDHRYQYLIPSHLDTIST